jgi:hypothetical protein
MLEMVRMTASVASGIRERLLTALDSLCQMTNDFTENSFTPHHQREQILDFLEEVNAEMGNLVNAEVNFYVRVK